MHRRERARQQVEAAGMHALFDQIVLPHDQPGVLGVAAAGAEHAAHLWMAQIIGADLRQRGVDRRVGGDHRRRDLGSGLLDRIDGTIDPRLQVELPRRGDEQRHLALTHQFDDARAHHLPGQEQVLADIGEPPVVAAARRIGVVAEHRDAGVERAPDRPVEAFGIDDADGDRVGLAGDCGVHRVDHLRHIRGFRAGPLIVAAEERAGVVDAVLARHKKGVGRDMIDEHEFPPRMRRKRPLVRRRCAAGSSGQRRRQRPRRDAAHHRAPRQPRRQPLCDLARASPHVLLPRWLSCDVSHAPSKARRT